MRDPLSANICKKWTSDISLTIGAFAYLSEVENEKHIVVSMVNTVVSKVIAAYTGVIAEDAGLALAENSLRIDTASYDLAAGVRAAGLDVSTASSQACVDGGVGATRMLFVREGMKLRPEIFCKLHKDCDA